MPAERKILIVVTSSAVMEKTGEPTGLWLEELATPYYIFVDAGVAVTLASILGGSAPIDPRSVRAKGENPASVDRFLGDAAATTALRSTIPVEAVDASAYQAVFLPGGHGTMWDLPDSAALSAALRTVWTSGGVVADVCHGSAGLVSAKDAAGKPLVAGRRITGFSNSEERAAGLAEAVPFLLETRLRELDTRYECGADFQPFAIADGRLVTGQNPASSTRAAELTLDALRAAAR
ncbi:type 1 glutamine amidotransferase domain-containing protein [Methylobacterium sp. J-048]|uniref:type 1 glutamine amidotransferase domain-containing protein n=1 Tax=Methylobacterium sp. J-048 TaxID=2836635 RepID=UPI001FBB024D|nr:type 1 glutamine amidotransferase domain-containing protein [Methylobacterium sp. J-048]MCJ2058030.1 type 1 glutamine amidotransferase domain-containing protein [Methylobacterium sp. J-048]